MSAVMDALAAAELARRALIRATADDHRLGADVQSGGIVDRRTDYRARLPYADADQFAYVDRLLRGLRHQARLPSLSRAPMPRNRSLTVIPTP
jgi:hypothetical protein